MIFRKDSAVELHYLRHHLVHFGSSRCLSSLEMADICCSQNVQSTKKNMCQYFGFWLELSLDFFLNWSAHHKTFLLPWYTRQPQGQGPTCSVYSSLWQYTMSPSCCGCWVDTWWRIFRELFHNGVRRLDMRDKKKHRTYFMRACREKILMKKRTSRTHQSLKPR